MCLIFLNIRQLSFGIFENHGIKETIYDLKRSTSGSISQGLKKEENSEIHLNVLK